MIQQIFPCVVIGFLSDIAITAEPQQCSPQTRFNYRRYNNTKMAFKELFCFFVALLFAAWRICQTDCHSHIREISNAI